MTEPNNELAKFFARWGEVEKRHRRDRTSMSPEEQAEFHRQMKELERRGLTLAPVKGHVLSPSETLKHVIESNPSIKQALLDADVNHDGRFSYAEFQHSRADARVGNKLDEVQKQLIDAYHRSHMPGFLVAGLASQQMHSINEVLHQKGLPVLAPNFVADMIRANPRTRS